MSDQKIKQHISEKKIKKNIKQEQKALDKNRFHTNQKEDAMLDAIDYKRNLEKVANLLEGINSGKISMHDVFGQMSPDAFATVVKLMYMSNSDKTKLECAKEILDRAGYAPVKRAHIIGQGVDADTTEEELNALIKGLATKTGAVDVTDD